MRSGSTTPGTLALSGEPIPLGQRTEAITPGPNPSDVCISVAINYTTGSQALIYWAPVYWAWATAFTHHAKAM